MYVIYILLRQVGDQLFVRLAFGTHSRDCPIHPTFRVVPFFSYCVFPYLHAQIVVVEKIEAYTRLAPPLLNRFEKQVMERSDTLSDEQMDLVHRVRKFADMFASKVSYNYHMLISSITIACCLKHHIIITFRLISCALSGRSRKRIRGLLLWF